MTQSKTRNKETTKKKKDERNFLIHTPVNLNKWPRFSHSLWQTKAKRESEFAELELGLENKVQQQSKKKKQLNYAQQKKNKKHTDLNFHFWFGGRMLFMVCETKNTKKKQAVSLTLLMRKKFFYCFLTNMDK